MDIGLRHGVRPLACLWIAFGSALALPLDCRTTGWPAGRLPGGIGWRGSTLLTLPPRGSAQGVPRGATLVTLLPRGSAQGAPIGSPLLNPPGDPPGGHPPGDIAQGTSASGHPPGDILHGTSRGRPPGFILQGAPSRGHPPGDILQRTSPSGHPADGSRGCPLGGRAPENEASSGDWERSGRAPGKGRTSGEL